jgi:hypothetical protein
MAKRNRRAFRDSWPIHEIAGVPPKDWGGWAEGKRFALVLTHDVDTARGRDRCLDLAAMEKDLGYRSAFNFVPERYDLPPELRETLLRWGFEIGVHGLNHDGKLFRSRELFSKRAKKINGYLADWNASGFRAPAMHHNLEWIGDLDIEYDSSTFDTDPFQPQPDAAATIFPFRVNGRTDRPAYVELPCTLPQDFVLFPLLREKGTAIWEEKLEWIAEKGGMAMMNTHPDYLHFGEGKMGPEDHPAESYRRFLTVVNDRFGDEVWHPLPRELARWFAETGKPKEEVLPEFRLGIDGLRFVTPLAEVDPAAPCRSSTV